MKKILCLMFVAIVGIGLVACNNKTKEMVNLLTNLNVLNNKVLVVVAELDENVCLASRNLANVKVVTFNEVNTYDTVNADNMIITHDALQKLEEVLTNE